MEILAYRFRRLREIDPDFAFGGGFTIHEISDHLDKMKDTINEYNRILSRADVLRREINTLDKMAREYAYRIYAGVQTHFGRSSAEYQYVGGTKLKDINFSPTQNKKPES